MNAEISSINTNVGDASRAWTISLWVAQLSVAGILGMMAFVKFFNFTPEGSMALATALGVGRGVVTLIGLVELTAVVTLLLPRLHAVGALLAMGTATGALFAHATKIGFSGNAAAEMWPLALVVLVASLLVLIARRRELPVVGSSL